MSNFWFNLPLWCKFIIITLTISYLFSKFLQNIINRKCYSDAGLYLILLIIMITGLINSLVLTEFRLF